MGGLAALNPWVWIVAGGLWIASTLGGYFYGHNEGYNAALAEQAQAIQNTLADFEKRVASSADAATKAALDEFKRRVALLDRLGEQLNKAEGTINAASAKLSASLKGGACVLSPAQRRLLECIRRPESPGCSPASEAVQPAVSRESPRAPAPAGSRQAPAR